MRILITFFCIFLVSTSFAQRKKISIDKREAKQAFAYLNAARSNPKRVMRDLGVRFNAKDVSNTQLRWNAELAEAAERRAKDMAQRDYFDHTTPEGIGPNHFINQAGYRLNPDWLRKRSANNFESIAANQPTAVDGIKAFIIGLGSPGYMHRKHVLGMDSWNGSLRDIGIGFVRVPSGARYKTYLCVIIAKHDWE
ncbi:CAP domain-containing protein [Sphingobacterium shayense]|uniref:CAP domain-containing protein n=1 Tax=Sphingobacterium shayense TaxID=626343 RepID=UPI0015528BF1|nr:CAP domain-containing protein [Sphingobacterium shayense]NQD70504.1 CAP domain-containing protein [Sphingobacterium shayense]